MSNQLKLSQHFFILLLLALVAGCAYHTRDEAVPVNNTNNCNDLVQFTYSNVESIFNNQSCTSCHREGGDQPQLSDVSTIKDYVLKNKDKFIQAIRFEGDHRMPKGGPPMPEADMKKIETWICQGMK